MPNNSRTPFLQAQLDFSAYSVTLTSSVTGHCTKITRSPVPVDGQTFSVPFYLEPANYSSFLDDTYSSFYTNIGYGGCPVTLPPSQVLPTYQGNQAPTSSAALSSATPAGISLTALPSAIPTEDSVPVRRVYSKKIIISSVLVPTMGLMIFLLCFIIIRRYRRKRGQAAFTNHQTTSNRQLYVDQKAELEDEARRKHELEAGGVTYEMEGEDVIFEMPTDGNMRMGLASSNRTHELRGAECSEELEVPGNT